jgi:hypothetical protein
VQDMDVDDSAPEPLLYHRGAYRTTG